MRLEDITNPEDMPMIYFFGETSRLRSENQALIKALEFMVRQYTGPDDDPGYQDAVRTLLNASIP